MVKRGKKGGRREGVFLLARGFIPGHVGGDKLAMSGDIRQLLGKRPSIHLNGKRGEKVKRLDG